MANSKPKQPALKLLDSTLSKKILALLVLALLIVGLLAWRASRAATPAGSWKILPWGDSTTQGGGVPGGHFSYRGRLYNMLKADGVDLQYVGMRKAGYLPPANEATDAMYHGANTEAIPDPYHGGYGAYGIAGDANCSNPQFDANCGMLGHADEMIPAGTNVILLMVGNNGGGDRAQQYEQLVDEALGVAPDAVFFLAGYLNRPGDPNIWQEIRDKAKQIADRSATDNLYYVDLNGVLSEQGDTVDGLHTSEQGANKVAKRFYDAMIASGVFDGGTTPPPPPPTPTPTPTPDPPPPPPTPDPTPPPPNPDPPPTPKIGDLNADDEVDFLDLTLLMKRFKQNATVAQGDFDNSGVIDILDLSQLISNWGQ